MRQKTFDKAQSLTTQSEYFLSAFRCAKHTHTCCHKLFIHCLEIVRRCAELEWQTFFSLSFSFKYVGWQRIMDEHESHSTVHALLSPQKVQHHHADEKEHGRTSRRERGRLRTKPSVIGDEPFFFSLLLLLFFSTLGGTHVAHHTPACASAPSSAFLSRRWCPHAALRQHGWAEVKSVTERCRRKSRLPTVSEEGGDQWKRPKRLSLFPRRISLHMRAAFC